MRRKDREVTDINEIIDIIENCKVMRIAMAVDDKPYVVPVNFAYTYENDSFTFFFHCAHEGKKVELLRKNPQVCVELDCGHELINVESTCQYSFRFRSIIGYGNAEFVTDPEEKRQFFERFMKYQSGQEVPVRVEQVKGSAVGRITVTELTAKARR